MRGQGSALGFWLTALGGIFVLAAAVGVYLNSVPLLDWPDFLGYDLGATVRDLTEPWLLYLILGLFLIQLSNGRYQTGHWHTLVRGLSIDPSAFYALLKEQLSEAGIPSARTSTIYGFQRGLLGPVRRYLGIRAGYFRFELLAAPFGRDFGFSWRCYYRMRLLERALLAMPALGWLLYYLFFRYTTYTEDKGIFFQSAVHGTVRQVIEQQLEQGGLRALSEAELQPIAIDMYGR